MRIIRLAVNKVLNLHILIVQFAFSISNKVFSLHKMSVGFFLISATYLIVAFVL